MQAEHEWFGGVSSRDTMELDPVGRHIAVGAQRRVQQTRWRNCVYVSETQSLALQHNQTYPLRGPTLSFGSPEGRQGVSDDRDSDAEQGGHDPHRHHEQHQRNGCKTPYETHSCPFLLTVVV